MSPDHEEPPGSPFHAGERFIHARMGNAERTERVGRQMIRTEMPEQHRQFFSTLPFVVVGVSDERGAPWAELLTGTPGFVSSEAPSSLDIEIAEAPSAAVLRRLAPGAPLGILGIELSTRRRNRANGHVIGQEKDRLSLRIAQSFGNCPKYITLRAAEEQRWLPHAAQGLRMAEEGRLSADAISLLRQADTCFVASASGDPLGKTLSAPGGLDVSHRGGPAGFLHVSDYKGRTRVTIPDYSGNQMFNTLGNLLTYRRAGLLVLDFSSRRFLSLTGNTEIEWDGPAVSAHPGAERLWHLDVSEGWLSSPIKDGEPQGEAPSTQS